MATVIYTISAKSNSDNKSEIIIRFKHGNNGKGIDQRTKSGIFINRDYWADAVTEGKKTISPAHIKTSSKKLMTEETLQLRKELVEAETKLNDLEKYVLQAFIDSGAGKADTPKDWLKGVVDSFRFPKSTIEKAQETEQQPTFFEAFEIYINGKKFSDNRKKHYQVLCRILKRYELFKGKELTFESLSAATLRDFEDFLKEEHTYYKEAVKQTEKAKGKKIGKTYLDIMEAVPLSRTPEPRGENAISDLMRRFRAFVRWANGLDKDYKLEKPITNSNPFNAYSVPKELYGTPYYITIEERNQLYNTQLAEPLATQRDIFVFQCCIGCRVSDLWAMTKASIIDGAVEYIPRKTKEGNPITVRVPLNKQATEIVEKYKDYEGKGLFPFTSQQEYNRSIKEIFEAADITRMVTVLNPTTREEEKRPIYEVASSHMARRTFVGNLYKKVKDPNAIGELSGHAEGSRAFKRYRAIDEETKKELVSMLD